MPKSKSKFYFFSRTKLKLVEIRGIKFKMTLILTAVVLFASATSYLGFVLGNPAYNTPDGSPDDRRNNEILRENLIKVTERFKELSAKVDSLLAVNNELRIAVNLAVLTEEQIELGVGGSVYEESPGFIPINDSEKIINALGDVDLAKRKINFLREDLKEVKETLKQNKLMFACIPAIRPSDAIINSEFGMRKHPILRYYRFHDGLDFNGDRGDPIYATGDGIVEYTSVRGGYGLSISINHGFGYKTSYSHLSQYKVKPGQKVKRGQIIALMGNSGLSTGPHLHYEVLHNGVKKNPRLFFFEDVNVQIDSSSSDITNKLPITGFGK